MSGTTAAAARLRDAGITVGAAALVAALTPIWLAHLAATRLAGKRRRGRTIPLPTVPASSVDVPSLVAGHQPVIIEGLGELLGVADRATPDALAELAGGEQIGVTIHDAAAPYFLYSGGYGARVVDHRTMSVSDFIELMFRDGIEQDVVVYRRLGPGDLDGMVSRVLGDFDDALLAHGATGTETRFSGVWIGSTGATTPLHHDAWPGLLFQTHGTKRVVMYGPRDRANLYFRNPLRGAGRWSDLPGRSSDASVSEFPRLARATRWEGELPAGAALFIPPYWAHEVEALEPNISVPFRFATPLRGYADPGFLRPAAEVLRRRLRLRPAADAGASR